MRTPGTAQPPTVDVDRRRTVSRSDLLITVDDCDCADVAPHGRLPEGGRVEHFDDARQAARAFVTYYNRTIDEQLGVIPRACRYWAVHYRGKHVIGVRQP